MSSAQEIDLQRNPIVQDSLAHNIRVLQTLRQPTSLLLGLLAGALSLTSFSGFIFYLAGSLLTSAFIYIFLLQFNARRYFYVAPEAVPLQSGKKSKSGKSKTEKEYEIREAGFSAGLVLNVLFGGGVLGVEGIMGFIMAWTLGFNYIGRGA